MDLSRELAGQSAPGERLRLRAYVLPLVVLIAIVLLAGVALAVVGPLPQVFPRLNCGDCGVLRP